MEINIKPCKISTSFKTEKIYPQLEKLEVTPRIEEQNYKGAYGELIIQGVTAEIDEDIKPENIKAGVNILGVDGGYEGIDTSDATATSEDILSGKTAYVNNELIEGTIQEYDGSYSGNTSEGIKITDASYLFYNGARTDYLNELLGLIEENTGTVHMFSNCVDLTELNLNNMNAEKILDASHTFYMCPYLTDLNMDGLDMRNVKNIKNMFKYCNRLINLKSFKNLGKGYSQKTANYNNYQLNLSDSTNLTHESLIDVITNGLYDLNLTYDVANGGTLYRQSLILGSTNLAKLTAEEIAIATNKGWDVS